MSNNLPEKPKSETKEEEKIEPGHRFLKELTPEEWKEYWRYTSYHHYM